MTGFRLLRYFSTVLSLIKAGHCIFTHSRPDKIWTPRILPYPSHIPPCQGGMKGGVCLTIGKISRSNTMPHLLSINEKSLMLLKPALHIAEFKFIKGISYAKC